MSDLMLYGVLEMPYEMAMSGEISRRQFWGRAQEAAKRLKAAEARLAELDRAPVSTPQQSAQRASVDTPEWRVLLDIYRDADRSQAKSARDALIAHINAWGSAGSGDGTAPERYTCKGKGGSYKLIGHAWPAGVLSSTLMVSSYPVYCDTKSGKLFVRTVGDFEQRMERIAAAPSPAPQGEQA